MPALPIDDSAPIPHSGDGWIDCVCGDRHWGLFGAAGLLLAREVPEAVRGEREAASPGDAARSSVVEVLLQHRSPWSHRGDTWGIPGGARDAGETALQGALREAHEEAGVDPQSVRAIGELVLDHGTWSYTTIVARAVGDVGAHVADRESLAIEWVPADDVERLTLLPAFGEAWPQLRAMLEAGS